MDLFAQISFFESPPDPFKLDIRKKFFTLKVVRPWPGLPREVGDAPSLGTSQARLDGARSSLIHLKMSLLAAGGWTGWPLKVLCHPNHAVILCIKVVKSCSVLQLMEVFQCGLI